MSQQIEELNRWVKQIDALKTHLKFHDVFTSGMLQRVVSAVQDSGYVSHIRTGDGFEMLSILMDEETKLDAREWHGTNTVTSIAELHPQLANNGCWQLLLPKLMKVSQKGTGQGEVVLSLILKSVTRAKDQDINASGLHLEAKDKTANIKAHGREHQSFRQTNASAKQAGWRKDNGKLYQGIFEESSLATITQYLEEVYFNWPPERVKRVAQYIHDHDTNEGNQYLGTEILFDYRAVDNFDLYLHFSNDGRLLILGDFEDRRFISENLKFRVPLRGNSTQALADGYASAQLFKGRK